MDLFASSKLRSHRASPVLTLILFCLVLLGSSFQAFAQDDALVTITRDGTSKADNGVEAARNIQAEVITATARERAIDILGEKRYQKSRAQVEAKVVRQSSRFIPYVNPGPVSQSPDGSWKMTVELKLSPSSLRKMILDAGLLNDADGPASILPIFSILDRQKNVSLRWWQGEPKDEAHKSLALLSRGMHDRMQTELARTGFHMIKPQGTQVSPFPEAYRVEKPSPKDEQAMSDFYNASMVMRGDLRFRESKDVAGVSYCSLKLQVVQVVSGRTIAEISRQFATDPAQPGAYEFAVRNKVFAELPEISKDLANQVLEAWQRGTLNTNLMKLAVRGQLSPKDLTDLKSGVMTNVREVKAITERMFEPNQVTLEMDYSGDANALVEKFKALQLPGMHMRVAGANAAMIALDVQK